MIDLDPQGNASTGFGIDYAKRSTGSYALIADARSVADLACATEIGSLMLVPADNELAGAEIELVEMERREYRLREALAAEGVADAYDYILIDCPPSLGLLTLNALVAAHSVLVPLQCEFFALEGVSQLIRTIDRVRRAFNPALRLEGLVLTMFDRRNNLSELVSADARGFFGTKVFETVIPAQHSDLRSPEPWPTGAVVRPEIQWSDRLCQSGPGADRPYDCPSGSSGVSRKKEMPAAASRPWACRLCWVRTTRRISVHARAGRTAEAGIHTLPVEQLEGGPFQPRQLMDADALEELANSIRTRGILQPILARPHPEHPERYQIIAGERRWRAAQMAGLHEVPVHIRLLEDADAMAASLVENLQRRDLNAIEEAEGMQRLMSEFGMTQEEMAGAVGKSRSHVANTVRLLQLPLAVRREVMAGALSAGHARALIGHPDPAKAALAVIAKRLTVRQTEAMAQANGVAARIAPASARALIHAVEGKDPEIHALERDLREKLGLRVEVQFNGRGGQLRIHYDTLDQLDGVLARLNQ